MNDKKVPVWALKFRNFLDDNKYTASDIAKILQIHVATVYSYRSGKNRIPDELKKKLETEIGLPIYDVFYNPLFDKKAVVTLTERN